MNVAVVAVGTRGDVEPHMALSAGLAARGHRVKLVAPVDFQERARALGFAFHPIRVAFHDLYGTHAGAALLASDGRMFHFIRHLRRVVTEVAHQVIADIREACRGSEGICYSLLGLPAHYVARDAGVPAVATSLQPLGRTRSFPSPLYRPGHWMPGSANLATHVVAEQAFWQLCRPLLKAALRTALPRWGHFDALYRGPTPTLFAFSPSVVPRPDDYRPWMHVTGFWSLPLNGWQPPGPLQDFLESGPPPVCVGFGSMNSARMDAVIPGVLKGIAGAGHRAILLKGWWDNRIDLGALGDDVYVADAVPHAWLFPRVAAAIHHGGAGTVAAALKAGVPSVVAPFFFDQWFWGRTLHRLKLGPEPIPFRRLSPRRVQDALEQAGRSTAMRESLRTLSSRLAVEDGVGAAVAVLEEAWSGRGN